MPNFPQIYAKNMTSISMIIGEDLKLLLLLVVVVVVVSYCINKY